MHTCTNAAEMQHLFAGQPNDQLRACIIVPARNEAALIAESLRSLYWQYLPDNSILDRQSYEVLLLVNNCQDDTYAIAMAFKAAHPDFQLHVEEMILQGEHAHIGTIRGFLMDKAYQRLSAIGKNEGIIISTDGDTRVDGHWLYHTLQEFDRGCDVVGGRIISHMEEVLSYKYHLHDVTYRYLSCQLESIIDPCQHDPWPRHFQCFGPSTAVRCDIYKKAGGMPPLPFLEDENFRLGLLRVDAKVRHSPYVKVYTSGRLEGKVDFGFSKQLLQWKEMNEMGCAIMVEPVHALKTKCHARQQLKQLFQEAKESRFSPERLNLLPDQLGVEARFMYRTLVEKPYFGMCWEALLQQMDAAAWQARFPLVSIVEGIAQLRQEINKIDRYTAA